MAIKFSKFTHAIKKRIAKQRNMNGGYQKLERTPSQEELENTVNEDLEKKIREGLKHGSIMLVLPPPVCVNCRRKIKA